jgi:hypothetical protein
MSLTFRKGGVNGNQVISIGASTTGYVEDTTHTDSVTSGDLIDTAGVSGAGTVNANVCFAVMTFTSSGTAVDIRQGSTRVAAQGFSNTVTNYLKICGGNIFVFATESDAQTKMPFAALSSNLIVNLVSTGAGSTQSMVTRKGGVTGNQAVAINPTVSGYVQDSTHSDSSAAGDLLNLMVPAIGNGNLAFNMIGLSLAGEIDASVNLTGVHATGVAGTLSITSTGNTNLVHVATTGVARALTPSVSKSLTLTGVHATGSPGTLVPSISKPLGHVATTGTPHAVSISTTGGSSPVHVSATGHAGSLGLHIDDNIHLVGVSAHGKAGDFQHVDRTLRGVRAYGTAAAIGVEIAPPNCGLSSFSIMRDTPVACSGAMDDGPVLGIGALCPDEPNPRSLLFDLAGVRAVAHAATITPFFNVNARLTGASATGRAGTVVGV